jgi:hypothetical protein
MAAPWRLPVWVVAAKGVSVRIPLPILVTSSILIVPPVFFPQDGVIRLVNGFHLLLGQVAQFMSGVLVGMVFYRQFPVTLFDFVNGCAP